MNEKIKALAVEADFMLCEDDHFYSEGQSQKTTDGLQKFAELIVKECVNREALLGAIARGWCSEKNSHKTMDPDLALAIFDEVEQQIKQQFGVEE
jgi:hypothetical protein